MKKVFFRRDNVELFLDNEPFASGGEGNLYRIRKPAKYTKFVVKLYHQDKRTAARQRKVEYMISNPPIDYTTHGHYPLIWPLGLVADRGFAGFMMPFAQGEKLEILCMPRIHRNLQARWGRFDFSRPEAMKKRLSICYNIATAVHQVHATDHYVLVDLKTDNIIIQPNGFVSIVDMDSVEIIDESRVLFPATVTTPEYTPPEYYTKNIQPGKVPIFESWDLFSLTVIFYKLLFGIHPFAASCNPPYDKLVSLHQKIEAGLFVHAASKQQHFKVVPPPHRNFTKVDNVVQSLFLSCFEDGHDNPDLRPVADEWLWAIAPSPQLAIDRKLPSKILNIGQVTYSKPLQLAGSSTQILPSLPPPKLPVVAQTEIESSLVVPRTIAGGTVGLFLLLMFAIDFSWSFSGLIQVATFLGTSMAMLYAYFREIPEKKAQRLAERKLKRLRAERQDVSSEIVSMKSLIARSSSPQQQQAKYFEKTQKQNLIEEKRKIEAVIHQLRQFLSTQDKEARTLLMEEAKQIQNLQKELFGETYVKFRHLLRLPVEEQIEWLKKEQNTFRKRIETKYQQKLANIAKEAEKHQLQQRKQLEKAYLDKVQTFELELKKLRQRRTLEEKRLQAANQIKVSEQLRNYNIRSHSKDIFSDNGPLVGVICDYLERSRIRSAADFVDVNSEGKIKKINSSTFQKVPFMTPERGVELKNWLINLRKTIGNPADLTPEEIQTLDKKYDDTTLKNQIAQLKQKHLKAIDELTKNNTLKAEKIRLTKAHQNELEIANQDIQKAITTLANHQDTYNKRKAKIEAQFNQQHELITEKCKTFGEQIKAKIENINNETYTSNKAILDQTINNIELVSSQSSLDIISNFNQNQKRLNELEQEFYEVKAESKSYRNVTFREFLRKTISFK